MEEITANLVKKLLPKRDPNGHKGTFGKVRIWGGAVGYTGAPVYAGEAACRTGSGLVFVAVPGEVYPIAAARCDTAMVSPAPEEYEDLRSWMSRCDAALIGPGLGRASDTERKVRALLEDLTVPVVLDADGINAVGTHIDSLASRQGRFPTVVTPHEEEFRRLGGDLSLGRERAAVDFARRSGCVVVLKGPGTVTAAPDGRALRNPTGNCGMAKGGSGDVLAGIVLSLLGQGADAFAAAVCAVWLHGTAGDFAARDLTEYAMTPGDLIGTLPAAFKPLGL